jgi:hypothetical protein
MARVDNHGIDSRYEVKGSGPPVLLMRGMGGSIRSLIAARYVDALRDEFAVDPVGLVGVP